MNKFEIDFSRLTEQTAKGMYYGASPELMKALENYFGRDLFDVRVRVKTYEDACIELNESPMCEFLLYSYGISIRELSWRKLRTISKALNLGSNKSGLKKYTPIFEVSKKTLIFKGSINLEYDFILGSSNGVTYESKELSDYAGQQFLELYKDFIL